MSETHFEVIVLGTGLTESITAAALSKAGFKVAHLDENPYYGGDEASLTLDELAQWADERTLSSSASEPSRYAAAQRAKFRSVSRSGSVLPNSRQYSLSLSPSVIPSNGPATSSLIGSGVSRYGGYKLLERIAVFDRLGKVRNVPGSKEDVFKSKDLSLVDKRRLMRFLMFASGEFEGKPELAGNETTPFPDFLRNKFSLKQDVIDAITYALAFCTSSFDPTLPALHRIRRYLLSSGRYGASPFLVGQYGGAGEIAQGFCRASAVHGGVYILGRKILSITHIELSSPPDGTEPAFSLQLDDLEDRLTADLIISSPDYVSPELRSIAGLLPPDTLDASQGTSSVARCIAIFDGPVIFPTSPSQQTLAGSEDPSLTSADADLPVESDAEPQSKVDTAVLVFPPGSLPGASATASATVLLTGEGTMSTPAGKCIAYISMPIDSQDSTPCSAETLLKPYLQATLSSVTTISTPPEALFSVFYTINGHRELYPRLSTADSSSRVLVTPPSSPLLPESMDDAACNAEALFRHAVHLLRPGQAGTVEGLWPPLENQDEEEDSW
ncbi:FAD/NAD P-binding domain-containing protein [Gloeophyllum trabeum ATCC 11539]|uniref:FAD/NAD P-binding domain-containing protein n=1 Tax=Gloeophyllum trabeum (strain ATCC 11539 / FP-39264 / Madison 617) TaxID=670483 RepID=S7S1T8_GLOTA|nr:FAD/NAD P-binding domain-containing protein [Gloeophyllum trabeum ATCC 11539]EPQ59734.1 FAD/NAD P-binding domain-containing protein [Gloeophyllum trabeum ATCC 11539]